MKTQISSKHAKMSLRVESLGLFGLFAKKSRILFLENDNSRWSFFRFSQKSVILLGKNVWGGEQKRLEIRFSLGFFMKNTKKTVDFMNFAITLSIVHLADVC